MITTPFTYTVIFKPTGQYYYGYRGRAGCHPNDLWTTYFTSSKIIKELIAEHGLDAFIVRIRKVFASADDARRWERSLLLRIDARNNPRMINQSNGGKGFTLKHHTAESRAKISASRAGMQFSDEHKTNIGNARRGKFTSDETKQKLSEALTGRKVGEQTRAKLREAGRRRRHSVDTKEKIGQAGRGRKLSADALAARQSNKACIADGRRFNSMSEAARELGLNQRTIKYRIDKGQQGYSFIS